MTNPRPRGLPEYEMFSVKTVKVLGNPGWLVTLIPGETTCLEHCSEITLFTAMPPPILATHVSPQRPLLTF